MSNQTKKILLKTDEKKIEAINKEAVNSAEKLNSLIQKCEKVCKTTFLKDERDNIRDAGMKFIKEYFKPKFQFPDADDKLNFQLLGIDLSQLEKTFKGYPIWREYPIEQNDNGVFELVGEPKQIQNCYTYAENERQVRGYELAVEISDLINRAIDEDFIPENEVYKLRLFGKILTANQGQTRVEVNPDRISRFL